MIWFLGGSLIFFLVVMAILLRIGYVTKEEVMGREAAQRNLCAILFWILFGFAIASLIPLIGKYGLIIFSISYVVSINIWLLSWFFRKQAAGALLLDVGKNPQRKFLFRNVLLQLGLVGIMTWLFFAQVSRGILQYSSLELEVSKLAVWWSFAIFHLASGLSKLELRENGICFRLSFIAWQRVKSYNWEQSQPNILMLHVKPRYPLFSKLGRMSIAIPAKHRDAVNHILNERFPDKNW